MIKSFSLLSKKCWVVSPQFWVKYGQNPAFVLNLLITFLTPHLGLSVFDPKLG